MITINIQEPRLTEVESTQEKSTFLRRLLCVCGLAVLLLLGWNVAAKKTTASRRRLKAKAPQCYREGEFLFQDEDGNGSEKESTFVWECKKARSDMAKVGAVVAMAGTGAGIVAAIPGAIASGLLGIGALIGGMGTGAGSVGANIVQYSPIKNGTTFTFKIGKNGKYDKELLVKIDRKGTIRNKQKIEYARIPVIGKPQIKGENKSFISENRVKFFLKSFKTRGKMCDRWVHYNSGNGNAKFKEFIGRVFDKIKDKELKTKLQDPKKKRNKLIKFWEKKEKNTIRLDNMTQWLEQYGWNEKEGREEYVNSFKKDKGYPEDDEDSEVSQPPSRSRPGRGKHTISCSIPRRRTPPKGRSWLME